MSGESYGYTHQRQARKMCWLSPSSQSQTPREVVRFSFSLSNPTFYTEAYVLRFLSLVSICRFGRRAACFRNPQFFSHIWWRSSRKCFPRFCVVLCVSVGLTKGSVFWVSHWEACKVRPLKNPHTTLNTFIPHFGFPAKPKPL